MINIRRAGVRDGELLSDIAYRSEAYWGYDLDFMEKFKVVYQITEDFLNRSETYIIEDNGNAVGFYSLLVKDKVASLEYLYIDAQSIGKGYGKKLWNHLVNITCKNLEVKEFTFVANPGAKDFYLKLGAIYLGEAESKLKKGFMLPKFVYKI